MPLPSENQDPTWAAGVARGRDPGICLSPWLAWTLVLAPSSCWGMLSLNSLSSKTGVVASPSGSSLCGPRGLFRGCRPSPPSLYLPCASRTCPVSFSRHTGAWFMKRLQCCWEIISHSLARPSRSAVQGLGVLSQALQALLRHVGGGEPQPQGPAFNVHPSPHVS